MAEATTPRRRSLGGAVLLIVIGALLLYVTLNPNLDPWPLFQHYWPLILIFVGLGKLLDYVWMRGHESSGAGGGISGGTIALILLVVIFGLALFHGHGRSRSRTAHDTRSVERRGAESVRATLDMPAGNFSLSGGATNLLEADFDYNQSEGKPNVRYDVSGKRGELSISQDSESNVHFAGRHNSWDLRFNNDVPLELKLNMGAGHGNLNLRGLSLTRLDVEVGAGQMTLDLTGDWKKDLQADIQGGVGTATIRLPKKVGVVVNASGGIGSVNAHGLKRDGDEYVNDAYGKSPVTLKITVQGGVGSINLEGET